MYKANQVDVPQLKELWKETFHDTDSYIELYFREKFIPEKTFVYKTDNGISSALYYSDVTLYYENNEYKAAYICGISTKEYARKKGQASILIQECLKELKSENYDIAFLIPATKSLIDFYKRFGFEIFSTLKFSGYTPDKGIAETISRSENCSDYYNGIPALKVKRSSYDFEILSQCYGKPFCFEDGYIYAYSENGIFYVIEHNYNNEKTLLKRINSVIGENIHSIKVKTPSVFEFGEEKPFSLYINFKNLPITDKRYINLLLN